MACGEAASGGAPNTRGTNDVVVSGLRQLFLRNAWKWLGILNWAVTDDIVIVVRLLIV
jgi:hypothetical protein